MNSAHYKVTAGLSGHPHPVLVAPNNEIIGKAKNFKTIPEVNKRIDDIRRCSTDVKNYEKKKTSNHQQEMFNLWNEDRTEILLTSETYPTAAARDKGIAACMKHGPTTRVIYPPQKL